MDHFKEFMSNLKGMEKSFNGVMNQALTPEVLAVMTPEQKEAIEIGKRSFNVEGETLSDKLNNINKNLEDVLSVIK